jgi:hypothetical protein
MTEVLTNDRPKRRKAVVAGDPVLVTSAALAIHFGVTAQYMSKLMADGVIERRADGLFDQDQSRLKYMTHLRSENRRSARAAADAEHTAAKAELLRLRIAEKTKVLMLVTEHEAFVDEMVGMFLSHLSGFAARCGGRDLAVRRAIDQAVYDLRVEISQAASRMADQAGEQ